MSERIKPWLRAAKYTWMRSTAEYKARFYSVDEKKNHQRSVGFLMGCGRSGTTILGEVLSRHPKVSYFFEPHYLWAAIEPKTDIHNLYRHIDAKLLMEASNCKEKSRLVFHRLFMGTQQKPDAQVVIEKTPHNSMRIGYLNALVLGAKFIHIVRDGVDVSCSIEKLALTNSYKIAGKPMLNQWWGVGNSKWKVLAQDGAAAGYYPNEVEKLKDDRSKAAYEWLVSLAEVDRWREQLGDRLHEITYDQFITNPETVLGNICQFLEIDSPKTWLGEAVSAIDPTRRRSGKTLKLPPRMCNDFNDYQERFGFSNRAILEDTL